MPSKQEGFTLIELMIVIAIVGILAAIAVPTYGTYAMKAKFSEVVAMTAAYKTGVVACAQDGSCVASPSALGGIALGTGTMPSSTTTDFLASIAVSPEGVITATAVSAGGLNGETYILTPAYTAGTPIVWSVSGTCLTRTGGPIC